jgi:putative DNA primase/helicase
MTLPSARDCQRISKLFALIGSDNEAEANSARDKLAQLLAKLRLSWNDLPEVLAAARDDTDITSSWSSPSPNVTDAPTVNVLDLVLYLLKEHVVVSDEERIAIALWVLHAHVFDRFMVTPRLALLSPVRECGKTTLIELIELLVPEAFRTDNVTPAPIYHTLANRRVVMLLDEADNLRLLHNPVLRAVFNSGHRRGGSVARLFEGRVRKFSTFGPLCVAAIGDILPMPLLGRSVTIRMQRYSPDEARPQLRQLDPSDPAFSGAQDELRKWAATCSLAQAPEMPAGFHNRLKDNWLRLLAIAEDLGHGEAARAAASVLRRSAGVEAEDTATHLKDPANVVEQYDGRSIAS